MDKLITFADVLPMEDTDIQENKSFRIDSYEKAEWALEKAGNAQAMIDRIERQAEELIEKVRAACDEKTK